MYFIEDKVLVTKQTKTKNISREVVTKYQFKLKLNYSCKSLPFLRNLAIHDQKN
jgi:hypothetical protein